MALEDFEKALAAEKQQAANEKPRHRHHDRERHRHLSRHHERHEPDGHHRHKRRKHDERRSERTDTVQTHKDATEMEQVSSANGARREEPQSRIQRDSWMEAPSAIDIDYVQKPNTAKQASSSTGSAKADFELKIHENELNKHHLQNLADGNIEQIEEDEPPVEHRVDYTFGDSGSKWRMTKLKGVYRRAEEQGVHVDEVAREHFGDLQSFDDAREEQIEMDRRATYGEGYIGKDKPTGDLYRIRKTEAESHISELEQSRVEDTGAPSTEAAPPPVIQPLDSTALNKLKAQMMKAKLRGSPNATQIEEEYNLARSASAGPPQDTTIIIGAMQNRMLTSRKGGEVKSIENKRGRERGLVEENEDMSIEDMLREERRTKGQNGGESRRFAERIAKDAKFDTGLDYMDENAAKLAKRVQHSTINLKNTAISDVQKMNRILDTCPLCYHEESNRIPVAPVVSLATRVYLTLPTEPEISDGGAFIVPLQHRDNLLDCDDDEWEEIRNFMKSLTRMYHDQGREVIFYENAATPHRKRHAGMQVVPIPYEMGDTAPAFFKEAILTGDEEWTQHKKLIDTLAKAKAGLGKSAFRRTLVTQMPYFHVWFELDGGLGHIVEDANRWPKGDLFAREIIGGMLDKGPEVIKRQGRWNRGTDPRVEPFRRRWKRFDWTRVLTDGL